MHLGSAKPVEDLLVNEPKRLFKNDQTNCEA